jgi:GcrA cell cycle regulator
MLQTSICARTPAGNSPGWNDARVETLTRLWNDGLAASVIAARLGEVTRNAVIGKVHRLGLPGRATTSRRPRVRRPHQPLPSRRSIARPPRTPAPAAITFLLVPFQPELPLGEVVTVRTLKDSHCRWPEGDPILPGFHFCGRRKVSGTPYCEHHGAIAFNAAPRRRRAA